jgi:hypothetical protein
MKKVLVAGIALLTLTAVQAQEITSVVKTPFSQAYKPFKVDISTGAAIPQGPGGGGGVLFSLEPQYTFLGKFTAGLRMEAAIMARGYVSSDGSTVSGSVAANASYLATYDYYLTKVIFKPFVGGGTGIYNTASASFTNNSQNTTVANSGASSKPGTMVRSGFEFHHFRFAIEYNFIGKTTQTETNNTTGDKVGTVTTKNGYCGIKLCILIGGGRK